MCAPVVNPVGASKLIFSKGGRNEKQFLETDGKYVAGSLRWWAIVCWWRREGHCFRVRLPGASGSDGGDVERIESLCLDRIHSYWMERMFRARLWCQDQPWWIFQQWRDVCQTFGGRYELRPDPANRLHCFLDGKPGYASEMGQKQAGHHGQHRFRLQRPALRSRQRVHDPLYGWNRRDCLQCRQSTESTDILGRSVESWLCRSLSVAWRSPCGYRFHLANAGVRSQYEGSATTGRSQNQTPRVDPECQTVWQWQPENRSNRRRCRPG